MSSPQRGPSNTERQAMKQSGEKNGNEHMAHPCTGGFTHASHPITASGGASCMQKLSALKDSALIEFALMPHGKDDPNPDVSQGENGYAVTLARGPFAQIIVLSFQSSLDSRNTPGKLILLVPVGPGGASAFSLASSVEQVDALAPVLRQSTSVQYYRIRRK